jgi:hypothetical protein
MLQSQRPLHDMLVFPERVTKQNNEKRNLGIVRRETKAKASQIVASSVMPLFNQAQ